jgi:hypothetical protein
VVRGVRQHAPIAITIKGSEEGQRLLWSVALLDPNLDEAGLGERSVWTLAYFEGLEN